MLNSISFNPHFGFSFLKFCCSVYVIVFDSVVYYAGVSIEMLLGLRAPTA